jgi:hypothetical protein
MKPPLKKLLLLSVLALGLVAARAPAEEHGSSLSTNLYNTLVGGYVATSVWWNYAPYGTNMWIDLYSEWYDQQKQQEINKFFLQARQTHGFWNSPQMLQYFLAQDNLRLVPMPFDPSPTTNYTLAYYPPVRRARFGPQYPQPYIQTGTPPLFRWWRIPIPPVQIYLGGPPWTNTLPVRTLPRRAN